MCGSMVDIQSATAEIRRGKKKERKTETTGQKYNGLPYSIGRPQQPCYCHYTGQPILADTTAKQEA